MIDNDDTIAAISTPSGEGGVGIVRLSGPRAIECASAAFRSSTGKDPRERGRRVFYGHILDAGDGVLDEVLLHVMRAPHSYTREDVVEINCHGGAAPVNAVLEEMLHRGARLARPGEFTQRAFLNGRIDLVQAEAVIDRIRARTRAGLRAAGEAAGGVLSRRIYAFRERLANVLAHIEAAVDFTDQDLPELLTDELFDGLRQCHEEMETLIETSEAGRLLREGVTVAIAGRPNVGKSSLFNALLRDARAIVTPDAGTTRDRIEEYITLRGVPVKLVDTAGLRTVDDEAEKMGVALAWASLRAAALILFVVDASETDAPADKELAEELAALETPVLLAVNKIDLAPDAAAPALGLDTAAQCMVSATTGAGIGDLEDALGGLLLGGLDVSAAEPMLTRLHQKDSLRRAADCVGRLLADTSLSPEFLALELQQALDALGEITGETTPEDILDTIFGSFCIGK